jgi:hypothetical protein
MYTRAVMRAVQVDVLFTDETFRLAPIGAQAPDGAQFLFVTATLPQEVCHHILAVCSVYTHSRRLCTSLCSVYTAGVSVCF